ncbi:MAG: hypothetical protein KME46_33065 [Brasilonema angustatum HA4187-MV1]|jgi:hypothetical protein|nr:hypothetical protein [Brasilonema angustatum HA4187-MV1]
MELTTVHNNGFVPSDNTEILIEQLAQETLQNQPQVKTKRNRNTFNDIEITFDSGANQTKAWVMFGELTQMIHFPSRARIVEGDISPDNIGNFSYGDTNYAVGKSADYYQGEWLEAREGNKIDYLDIWFLGVLTHAKKLLLEAAKKRKQGSNNIKIRCWVRVLTLAKERKHEIEKILKDIQSFTFADCTFEIVIGAIEVLPEGYGSAITAWNKDKLAERINILDMGGGTLSYTSYSTEFGELDCVERTIADCGGINAIVATLQLSMSSRDNAGIQLYPELLEKALRTSKSKQVFYDFGSNISNIYNAFISAMNDWLKINPQVQQLLKNVRFSLMNGEKVYLTGGGFSCLVIREFISEYLIKANSNTAKKRKKADDITLDNNLIIPLEDCHTLNITGLKELPSLIPQK